MANPFRAALDHRRGPRSHLGSGSAYAGAVSSRLTADWVLADIRSADQEIRGDLRTLRARSRELVRNNDTAHRYVSLVDEQAIGHEGIRFQAHVEQPDGMLDMDINERIEEAFAEWAEPANCTVDGRHGLVDVLANWARTTPQDGEWILRMVPYPNKFGFALQLLDADQLDHEFNRAPGEGSRNEIRMGVEIDRWGRPVAYHVWDHHPSEYTARGRERVRLPADQIIHWYRSDRIGATRGVPWFAPALFKLRMIAAYEEAEIVAARIGSAQGGFFVPPPEQVPDPNAPAAEPQINYEIEPGRFDRLPPGWTFAQFDPKHPTDAFADFHQAMVRGVASGLDVSYVSLANDLAAVNYSSIRAGLLNERDAWRRLQWSLVRHVLRRLYRQWHAAALRTGALRLPDRNRERWLSHRWQPRGWPWVDPETDIQAGILGVRAGVNSLTRICAAQGLDFEEVLLERAYEIRLAEELGVPISTDVSRARGRSAEDERGSAGAAAAHPGVGRRLVRSRALATYAPDRIEELLRVNGRHE